MAVGWRRAKSRRNTRLISIAVVPERDDFLLRYRETFPTIQGDFSYHAALLFMAYAQLLAERGIAGDVLEVGVHHGLSAIAVAALRGPGRRFVAVDLFTEQERNVSGSGSGDEAIFLRNLRALHGSTDFVQVVSGDSTELRPDDLGRGFSFAHIDGGHSARETFCDLDLARQVLVPGGIVALDDYFNPAFPGVCEGALRLHVDHPDALIPLAIGWNKVLFQKGPAPFDLPEAFAKRFHAVHRNTALLWEWRVPLFGREFAAYVDLARSTPRRLVPVEQVLVRARIEPLDRELSTGPGATVMLRVRVTNDSSLVFAWSDSPFGLSYHVRSRFGRMLRYENARTYIREPVAPGGAAVLELPVAAPDRAGEYRLDLDLVWEGICWFADRGNPVTAVKLTVR